MQLHMLYATQKSIENLTLKNWKFNFHAHFKILINSKSL
jgi:hypothetical protein